MSFVAPNWKNESEYPRDTEDHFLSFWAWQFLRRNSEYQTVWETYAAGLQAMADRLPELRPFVQHEIDPVAYPPIRGVEYGKAKLLAMRQPEYVEVTSIRDGTKLTKQGRQLDAALSEKFGLKELYNPKMLCPPRGAKFEVNGARFTDLGSVNHYVESEIHLTPVFDLRYPVEVLRSQFEQVLAERERRISSGLFSPYSERPDRSKRQFPSYLRVLDATDAGAKISEIADELLPHQEAEGARKSVRNWLNAAKRIREGDYKMMPAYDCFPSPVKKR